MSDKNKNENSSINNQITTLSSLSLLFFNLDIQENQIVEEKMEEIRVINRAKWELINRKNMTEPTAHQYIIQESMNRRMTKKAVAEEIINMYEAGG